MSGGFHQVACVLGEGTLRLCTLRMRSQVAAFAKKLAQLALRASPSGAMVASSIIFNMIKKHSAVRVLVQRDALGTWPSCPRWLRTVLRCGQSSVAGPTPYDAAEPDHAKCGALSSSLWELSALKQVLATVGLESAREFLSLLSSSCVVRLISTEHRV